MKTARKNNHLQGYHRGARPHNSILQNPMLASVNQGTNTKK